MLQLESMFQNRNDLLKSLARVDLTGGLECLRTGRLKDWKTRGLKEQRSRGAEEQRSRGLED
jgi:hypothetical protein